MLAEYFGVKKGLKRRFYEKVVNCIFISFYPLYVVIAGTKKYKKKNRYPR